LGQRSLLLGQEVLADHACEPALAAPPVDVQARAPGDGDRLVAQALPKGDVLTTAKVAGVLAAKQTPALIPLTHPVPINSVDITFDLDPKAGSIEVRSIVRCEGKTGVEMEAMTACAVACLTIYDMCKSAEKGITIESLQLVRKSGGKSGLWER